MYKLIVPVSSKMLNSANKMDNEKYSVCSLSTSFLKLSFMWPPKNEELNPSKQFYIRAVIFVLVWFFTFHSVVILHLWKSLKEGGIDVSEDFSIIAASTGFISMMVMYIFKQKKLALLLQDMSDFTKFGKPPGFDEANKKLNLSVKFFMAYSVAGSSVYNLVKIFEIPKCRRDRKIEEFCGVLIPAWLPFHINNVIMAVYIYLIILTLVRITLLCSIQVLEISWNIKLRIEHLKMMVTECFTQQNQSNCQKYLVECIRYHICIIDWSIRFSDSFSNVMFIHLTTTGLICGCLENQIIKDTQAGAIMHIFGWISALFVSCLGGQILIDSSTSVADAVYNSSWYESDIKTRKCLKLMMMRSQKPLFVATGPFNVLSYTLFVSIMKMSYSILTLLN